MRNRLFVSITYLALARWSYGPCSVVAFSASSAIVRKSPSSQVTSDASISLLFGFTQQSLGRASQPTALYDVQPGSLLFPPACRSLVTHPPTRSPTSTSLFSSKSLSNLVPKIDSDSIPEKLTVAVQIIAVLKIVTDRIPFRPRRKRNRIGGRKGRPRWTKSHAFQGLCRWAFDVCDDDKNGYIRRQDLYAGILLVHLNMAKYVGVAATHPLNQTQVDDLFQMADVDNKGMIGLADFEQIVMASCLNIGSRIVVYYAMLVFMAPWLTSQLIKVAQVHRSLVPTNAVWAAYEWIMGHFVSVFIFTATVPWIIDQIDMYSPKLVVRRKKKLRWWHKLSKRGPFSSQIQESLDDFEQNCTRVINEIKVMHNVPSQSDNNAMPQT